MVGLPQSSAGTPDGWPPRPGPKFSKVELRKRREEVEIALLDGRRTTEIANEIAAKWGVSIRMVMADVKWVERQWDIEDRRHANRARQRVIRRLEHLATKLERKGKEGAAALVLYRVARLRGMGLRYELEGGATVKHRVELRVLPADAATWWRQFLAGAEEQGLVPAGSLARLLPEAEVEGVRTEPTGPPSGAPAA